MAQGNKARFCGLVISEEKYLGNFFEGFQKSVNVFGLQE